MGSVLVFPTYSADIADVPHGQAAGLYLDSVLPYGTPAWNASAQQIQDFLNLNYLMRPPLTDAEIRAMPAMEVVALYYNLRSQNPQPQAYPIYVVDPKACAGLPQEWAWGYTTALQRRIYNLRPEMHYVIHPDTKVTYPLLLSPDQLDYRSGDTALSVAATVVGGLLTIVTPALGILIAVIANTVSAGLRGAATAQALSNAAKAKGIVQQVLYGVSVQSQLSDHKATSADLDSLLTDQSGWQQMVKAYTPNVASICSPALRMPYPVRVIVVAYEPDVNTAHPSGPSGKYPGLLVAAHGTDSSFWTQNPPPASWWDQEDPLNIPMVGTKGLSERGINPNYYSLALPMWKNQINYERSQVQAYVNAWRPASFFYSQAVASAVAAYASARASTSQPKPSAPPPISGAPPGNPAVAVASGSSNWPPAYLVHQIQLPKKAQPAADGLAGIGGLILLLLL